MVSPKKRQAHEVDMHPSQSRRRQVGLEEGAVVVALTFRACTHRLLSS